MCLFFPYLTSALPLCLICSVFYRKGESLDRAAERQLAHMGMSWTVGTFLTWDSFAAMGAWVGPGKDSVTVGTRLGCDGLRLVALPRGGKLDDPGASAFWLPLSAIVGSEVHSELFPSGYFECLILHIVRPDGLPVILKIVSLTARARSELRTGPLGQYFPELPQPAA